VNTARQHLKDALPFWLSLSLVPLLWWGAFKGGWATGLAPLVGLWVFGTIDAVIDNQTDNRDPQTPEAHLFWHRLITMVWFPIQAFNIFALIWYVTRASHLGTGEMIGVFASLGVLSGTIGIVYAHELMHQSNRLERWLSDLLLASVLYSHFRSEHLLVHHRHVGTPADAVTALYNEGFYRFFVRVLPESVRSAWNAEKALLARKDLPALHPKNPHVRYWGLQLVFVITAISIGGVTGLLLFLVQAFVAVLLLELTNYIEHYGLVRKHLGDGKYEPVKPHHSWNASDRLTNFLMINLQRHSDHHYKPARRFPLLQNYSKDAAPQLPAGYSLMGILALTPPAWRRVMNPKVKAWRAQFYPEMIGFEVWEPYKRRTNPKPRA